MAYAPQNPPAGKGPSGWHAEGSGNLGDMTSYCRMSCLMLSNRANPRITAMAIATPRAVPCLGRQVPPGTSSATSVFVDSLRESLVPSLVNLASDGNRVFAFASIPPKVAWRADAFGECRFVCFANFTPPREQVFLHREPGGLDLRNPLRKISMARSRPPRCWAIKPPLARVSSAEGSPVGE